MIEKQYILRYLPIFYDDLLKVVNYISVDLKNKHAAEDLLNLTESAIKERVKMPEVFEQFHSIKERKYPYYRIYIKNYIVFYVVIPDEADANIATMEVRRFLYNKRKIDNLI